MGDRCSNLVKNRGPKVYIVTTEVPQGSIMDAVLCNVMYNTALVLPIQENTTIDTFAGKLASFVKLKHLEDLDIHATWS